MHLWWISQWVLFKCPFCLFSGTFLYLLFPFYLPYIHQKWKFLFSAFSLSWGCTQKNVRLNSWTKVTGTIGYGGLCVNWGRKIKTIPSPSQDSHGNNLFNSKSRDTPAWVLEMRNGDIPNSRNSNFLLIECRWDETNRNRVGILFSKKQNPRELNGICWLSRLWCVRNNPSILVHVNNSTSKLVLH